ncbi:MAG: NAD-dependent epimerase/dehydratase family protein, partial [Nitrospirota bacterium]
MEKASTLANKRILISGASGFIGSHLSMRLYRIGAELHGIFRTGHAVRDSNLTWWQGDMEDETFVREVLSSVKP